MHIMPSLEVALKKDEVSFLQMKLQYSWIILKAPKSKEISIPYLADVLF